MGGTLATKGRESDKIVIESGMSKRIKKNEVNFEDSTLMPCRLAQLPAFTGSALLSSSG